MTADFVMSLSRKVKDKIGNTGRFHVIKNRFGPDGITYPAKVNTNTKYCYYRSYGRWYNLYALSPSFN